MNSLFKESDKIYIDELNNVIYDDDWVIILGKVNNHYRFIPNKNIVLEQGLTPNMMLRICYLIKELYEKKGE